MLTYAGHYLLPKVIAAVEEAGLRYWWMCGIRHDGPEPLARMQSKGIIVGWKPIVWFIKGTTTDRDRQRFVVDFIDSRREKDYHDWQQSLTDARHFIERLTDGADLVVDPMCGSGTTLVAAKQLGRRWLGCDVDEAAIHTARTRLEAAK